MKQKNRSANAAKEKRFRFLAETFFCFRTRGYEKRSKGVFCPHLKRFLKIFSVFLEKRL
jgi:hypothetical protein